MSVRKKKVACAYGRKAAGWVARSISLRLDADKFGNSILTAKHIPEEGRPSGLKHKLAVSPPVCLMLAKDYFNGVVMPNFRERSFLYDYLKERTE